MSNPNLKEIIKQEYIKCSQDPVHFMRKYCYIQHPQRGRIQFNLYPFQEKVLTLFKKHDYTILLKSRQLGISTLAAGYATWLMLFHKDKNVLALATTQATARNIVSKVKFMWENLPSWLKVDAVENNKLSLHLVNGSKIQAKSSNSDSARSEAVSLLIIDEAAFIENIGETWASAQQTLATGGGAIVLSTPFGTGNWFHQTWVKAEQAENDFVPIKLPWAVHPERDQSWRDRQDELLGDPRLAAQECDCDFSTSGDIVFYNEYLEYYEKTYIKEPLERRGVDQNLWVWESPDYTRSYIVVADVARGDGKDYSTFHVIDVESNVQVAEYKGQIGTKEFGHLLVGIATEYNEALLVIENANIGWATIQVAIDRNYSNLYYSPRAEANADSYFDKYMDTSKAVAGFTMSARTRPMVVGKFQEYISEKSVTIQSKRLIEEMKVFIWKNGRAEAQQGYNDDLVMAFGIAMYIRDTALKYRQRGLDLTRSALNNITVNRTSYQGAYYANKNDNPYQIENPYGGKEDISWLL
ncbi:MAG: terminase large subunit domain-containing protein [Sediminibacterium sp.]